MNNQELSFRDKILFKYSKEPFFMRIVMNYVKFLAKIFNFPGLRNLHPWIDSRVNRINILPINQELKQEEVLLPMPVINEFINKAKHINILNVCACRQAYGCKNHSPEIGCIYMGDSTLDIHPAFGQPVTKEEAHEHARKAMSQGLLPVIGKAKLDNFIFSTPDIGKLLSICFCCHCCCVANNFKKYPVDHFDNMIPAINGLKIEITEKCNGCGICLEYCLFDGISVENGAAVHNERCRGCGRCATHCPENAVKITLDNPNAMNEVIERFNALGDVT